MTVRPTLTSSSRALGRTAAVALLSLLVSAGALAAGSVRYEVRDTESNQTATMQIEWLNGQRVRMEVSSVQMPEGMQAWTLLRDDKLYSVNVNRGQATVMEMSSMLRMAGRMATQAMPGGSMDDMHELQEFRATGRRETVAGVSGEVYLATWRDGRGQTQQSELVLSTDRTVVELSQAMLAVGRQMAAATESAPKAGRNALEQRLQSQQMGLLRMGDQMRAVEVNRRSPGAERFELPAAPISVPNMAGLAGLLGAAQAAAQGSGEGAKPAAQKREPNAAERQAARQQERVQGRAEQEVDKAADNAVDKAIGRLWDKLRGQ